MGGPSVQVSVSIVYYCKFTVDTYCFIDGVGSSSVLMSGHFPSLVFISSLVSVCVCTCLFTRTCVAMNRFGELEKRSLNRQVKFP